MPYLALAVEEDGQLGASAGRLGIEPRIAPAIQRELGNEVLLYRRVGTSDLAFFARARLSGLRAPKGGGRQCELEDLLWFGAPVADAGGAATPGARRMLSLGEQRFAAVLETARVPGTPKGVGEVTSAAAFETVVPPREFLRIHDEVMRRWQYRCAVTDVQFAPGQGLHPHLRLVPIRPRSLGGPLEPANFLPMVELAEHAWITGVISVGPELDLVVVPNRLDPDLLEAMPPDGRLIVPDDPALRPDPSHLAFHRTRIFASFG